jgi:hypothetical protein
MRVSRGLGLLLHAALLGASAAASSRSADIPPSCQGMVDATGLATVKYLANVGAGLTDATCQAQCLSSICASSAGSSAVSSLGVAVAAGDAAATAAAAAGAPAGALLETQTMAALRGTRGKKAGAGVPGAGVLGCPNECSGHGACLQDCRNKAGAQCLQDCKSYDAALTCACSKRCVCNSDWGGKACDKPLLCEACSADHGKCTNGKCLCDPGFEGPDCTKRIRCPKSTGNLECGGDARGICNFGKCTCKAGFEGKACQTETPCDDDCSKNGLCVRGECACFKGWAGATCAEFAAGKPCSTSASPQGDKAAATTCSGHGVCHAGQCVCHPDFTGKSCGMTKQCPRGAGKQRLECSGRGSCWLGKCICRPGSTGLDCGEMLPCDCSGHGACHASSAGGCVCHPGWTGTNCATEEVCPDDCSGNGVCNDGSCFCFKGYAGDSCAFSVEDGKEAERRKNCVNPDVGDDPAALARVPKIRSKETGGESPAPCSGHGVCGYEMSPAPGSGKAYGRCLCMPGYLGDYCEEEIKCPNDCLGHGTCVAGKCKCRYGYSGEGCQDVIVGVHLCPDDCSGQGTCMLDECFCEPGFIGASCNVTVPCPSDCSGNGKCDRGRCLCSIGFEGADCSKKSTCPNDCNNHGVCSVGGTCLCEPGYAGEACEYSPGCGDKICDNGGLCRDGACLCPNGFTGDTCSRLVPGASMSRPKCPKDGNGVVCGGHGVCPEGERACKCEDGWSGDTCTEAEMPAGVDVEGGGASQKKVGEEDESVQLLADMSKMDALESKAMAAAGSDSGSGGGAAKEANLLEVVEKKSNVGGEEPEQEGEEESVRGEERTGWSTESVSVISVSLLLVAFGVGVVAEKFRQRSKASTASSAPPAPHRQQHQQQHHPQSVDYNAPLLTRNMNVTADDASLTATPVTTGFLER